MKLSVIDEWLSKHGLDILEIYKAGPPPYKYFATIKERPNPDLPGEVKDLKGFGDSVVEALFDLCEKIKR
jgi:hypothetical protein